MTVRMEMPSTSNCAASGVRSSSAWAARVITTECAHAALRCQASELVALRAAHAAPMLLEAMFEQGLIKQRGAISGLRTLALLLPR